MTDQDIDRILYFAVFGFLFKSPYGNRNGIFSTAGR